MKASLIICTRNRADRLGVMLQYLELVDFCDAELIFVNNGSDDRTGEILSEWAQGRVNVQIALEPVKGLGRARNTGWRLSKGDVVVFTDDDCYPYPDYVQQHIKIFENAPNLGWATGRILLFDPNDAKITIQENTFLVNYPAYRFLHPGSVHGANLSFRKSALESIQGFDPLMGVGSYFPCEDLDAAARACFEGYTGIYSPDPVVQHHHGRQTQEQVRTLERLYRMGTGNYYGKSLWNPTMRKAYLRGIAGKWWHAPFLHIVSEALAIWYWRRVSWTYSTFKK